jgi:serine/threonine protein kinase
MHEQHKPAALSGEQKDETVVGGSTTPSAAGRIESFDFLAPAQAGEGLGWLAHYRVIKLLGAGGMGMVFHAEDTHLNRSVALKVVRPDLARDELLRQRFLREARAMAAVKSDYIVTVYQVDQANDIPFLAMEFLEGQSLDDWLTHGGRPDIATVLRLGREMALGLAAAHERGLIHRDIKPANVFLEAGTSRVKILDFGLARPAHQKSDITVAGTILGTPEYMAPEQADGEATTQRSDLFSLGCVLYQLLAGKTPFAAGNTMAVLKAVALKEPPSLCQVNSAVPQRLADLVSCLLAKDPAKRPASAISWRPLPGSRPCLRPPSLGVQDPPELSGGAGHGRRLRHGSDWSAQRSLQPASGGMSGGAPRARCPLPTRAPGPATPHRTSLRPRR